MTKTSQPDYGRTAAWSPGRPRLRIHFLAEGGIKGDEPLVGAGAVHGVLSSWLRLLNGTEATGLGSRGRGTSASAGKLVTGPAATVEAAPSAGVRAPKELAAT